MHPTMPNSKAQESRTIVVYSMRATTRKETEGKILVKIGERGRTRTEKKIRDLLQSILL